MSTKRRVGGLALAALLVGLAGCGSGSNAPTGSTQPSGRPPAGGGGALSYAVAGLPADLDPLGATSREAQLITLQTHEPLVARLNGPYGDNSSQPGLARSIHPSANRTVWTLQLRDGVRFQDGTPFNATAVLANAQRWQTLPAGRALLPDLFAVDAPRPDLVRFLLRRPSPKLPQRARLAAPRNRLAGVAAAPQRRVRATVAGNVGGPGTGAFQLNQINSGQIFLARYLAWWGTPLGLGPALDQIEFTASAAEPERLNLLQSGQAQVADGLSPASLAVVRRDPLLTALPGGAGIGLQRSVRGIDSAAPVPFSGLWLTTIEPG